ncbi:MAG: SWIM zinc finger family protein [Chloroflexi bacterium]|nr:SWIM zinc finger family protein [Chloroflexota bacterium]
MSHWYSKWERSSPREARGGIRPQSKRGTFGETWWSRRWIEVLESFDIGTRLARGRSYARNGRVLSIDIKSGVVTAAVQGSERSPYSVSIQVSRIPAEGWKKVTGVLSTQAIFAASLLAGEMPGEIESAFQDAGVSLFPVSLKEIKTECSCPDWSNPCKHIAAVYYLLGEEFDRDPFLIFKLRGMEKPELIKRLGAAPAAAAAKPAAPPEPLPVSPAAFWTGAPVSPDLFGEVRTPPVHAALLLRLGSLPFWRGSRPLVEELEPVYRTAAESGVSAYTGGLKPVDRSQA